MFLEYLEALANTVVSYSQGGQDRIRAVSADNQLSVLGCR
jgi:hypothetical protein